MKTNDPPITFAIDAMLDESANPEFAPLGTLTQLQNYQLDRNGVLEQRKGFRGNYKQYRNVRLLTAKNVPASFNGHQVFGPESEAVIAGTSSSSFDLGSAGYAPDKYLKKAYDIPGASGDGLMVGAGVVADANHTLIAWQDASNVWYQFLTPTTKISNIVPFTVVFPTQVDRFKLVAIDGLFCIVASDASANTIYVHRGTTSLAGTPTAVITDLDGTNPAWDVAAGGTTGAPALYIAYHRNFGGVHLLTSAKITSLSGTPSADSLISVAARTSVAITCAGAIDNSYTLIAAVSSSSGTVETAVVDSTNTIVASIAATSGTVTTGTVDALTSSAHPSTDGRWYIVASCANALATGNGSQGDIAWNILTYSVGSVSESYSTWGQMHGAAAESSPFHDGHNFFVWARVGGGYAAGSGNGSDPTTRRGFSSYALMRLSRGSDTSYWNTSVSFAYETDFMLRVGVGSYVAAASSNAGTTVATIGSSYLTALVVNDHVRIFDVRDSRDGSFDLFIPENVGSISVCTGSFQPNVWDRLLCTELGFADQPGYELDVNGSGSVAAGDYQYAVTYESFDASGNRYQSAPVFSNSFTVASPSSRVRCLVDSLAPTSKQGIFSGRDAVRAVLWRTVAGPGSVFYRVTSNNFLGSSASATLYLYDTNSDATLVANSTETIYAPPGSVASNEMPPPTRHLTTFGNRVAGIDAEYEGRIWFSKVISPGEGISHSSALETYVHGIGDLVALSELDGQLYAFSEKGIALAAYGSGPNDALQGSWPEPQVLTMGIGCIGPHAITVIPDGALFAGKSDDSILIWLMPRGGGMPIDVGGPVVKSLDAATDVLRVASSAAQSRVYILLDTGKLLVYDYANRDANGRGRWYVWTLPMTTPGDVASVGDLVWVANQNDEEEIVVTADLAADTDTSGTPTSMSLILETARIRPGRPFSAGKLNEIDFASEYRGDATMTVAITRGESDVTSYAFAYSSLTSGELYSRSWQPAITRDMMAQGFRLKFTQSNMSAGVIPRFLEIDYIAEQGGYRPLDTERA